ncbi:MAG TPA: flagellar basal body P-ring formation chaperone FlgA [Kofleriaceae bacterium]|nr:flagellar basal body P-ring formation chaperone FlgA [Kofleriaceae bacterium]
MRAVCLLCALAGAASADPIDAIVRDRVAPTLPANLGVAKVDVPPALAALDVDPAKVAIELPHELRAGRASVKVTVGKRAAVWCQVSVAAIVEVAVAQRALAPGEHVGDADIAIEDRALAEVAPAPVSTLIGATVTRDIAAGAPIGAHDVALPPPLPRGTQVEIDVRRGAIHIHGTATLEIAARIGEVASARLAATNTIVRGTLVAPQTLVVGDMP